MLTLSIDWEDFGQLFAKYHCGRTLEPVNGTIERQTGILLDLLAESGNKATFFILGMLARYRPELVKKIASAGHEIAMHGQNHESACSLTPEKCRKDLEDAYKTITDITGKALYGYRAPFFSLNASNLYVLEYLSELGLIYDSSIFPVKLPRYGIDGFEAENALYALPNGKEIVELPLTTVRWLCRRWPVAGGGYIRLMPGFLVKKVFAGLEKNGKNSIIYMHPYEFDPRPLDLSDNYPPGTEFCRTKVRGLNLKWNLLRRSVTPKIRHLLKQYRFTTCGELARHVKDQGNCKKLLAQ